MRRFIQWLNKRFGTFDLLPEYFTDAASQMQNILWGALLPFLVWGIWFIVSTPPTWINITAIGLALFIAGYYVWRADHVRLQQRLEVTGPFPQLDVIDGRDWVLYYFCITNESEALTIYRVHPQLKQIEPEVQELNWLPVT